MDLVSLISGLSIAAAETTTEHTDDSGSFLGSPDVGLMIWTFIVFGVSFYVLRKVVYPRLQEALDRRQHAIEESIDAAAHTREQAEELLAEDRERLGQAPAQAEQALK